MALRFLFGLLGDTDTAAIGAAAAATSDDDEDESAKSDAEVEATYGGDDKMKMTFLPAIRVGGSQKPEMIDDTATHQSNHPREMQKIQAHASTPFDA